MNGPGDVDRNGHLVWSGDVVFNRYTNRLKFKQKKVSEKSEK